VPRQASISVVTVVLNDLAGLKRTWASVKSQTEQSIEWIVVDGGSADGTDKWLASTLDSADHWRSAVDRGIYDAMNWGLQESNGRLVHFLNAGDVYASGDVVERVLESYQDVNWAWAYGAIRLVSNNDRLLRVQYPTPFRAWKFKCGLSPIPHPGTFMATAVARELHGFRVDAGLAADQDLLYRALARSQPHLLDLEVVDFDTSGASSRLPPDHLVWALRDSRTQAESLYFSNDWIDARITSLVARAQRLRSRFRTNS
jgi:hypothetical protein